MNSKTTLKALALSALMLSAALALGCGDDTEAGRSSAPHTDAAPVAVELRTAAYETAPLEVRATGSLEPLRKVSPASKILGRIETVAVREGERVREGALLARLESRDLEAAVKQAEAAVRMARAQRENAAAQRERMMSLHGRGSVTDKNLEDAVASFRVAEASLDQAEADLDAARVMLGYAEIRSPLTGWVVAKHFDTGDMATPGSPLFTLEDLSRVEVDVQVPEADVVGLEEGTPARVRVLDLEIEATVDRIVPSGDPASRTFSVRLLLDNPDQALKSGMFARVSFRRGEHRVLRVEPRALVTRGQLEGLFVAGDDGRVRLRWVRTGRDREILSGLEEGERYVVDPPAGLTDGARYTEARR